MLKRKSKGGFTLTVQKYFIKPWLKQNNTQTPKPRLHLCWDGATGERELRVRPAWAQGLGVWKRPRHKPGGDSPLVGHWENSRLMEQMPVGGWITAPQRHPCSEECYSIRQTGFVDALHLGVVKWGNSSGWAQSNHVTSKWRNVPVVKGQVTGDESRGWSDVTLKAEEGP